MAMVCARRGKVTEKLRDRPHYVNIKCSYCPCIGKRHVQTLAVTQVVKLLRPLRGTGRLITVFTAGTFLIHLNSVCTVTRYFFMSRFNNIFLSKHRSPICPSYRCSYQKFFSIPFEHTVTQLHHQYECFE